MAKKGRQHRLQKAFTKFIARVPWLRRRYSKWILRYIEKSKTKGRALPPELQRLDRQMAKLPPGKRMQALETALVSGTDESGGSSRELRRAMARQQRQRSSGKGQRPGSLGGSRITERR